MNINVSVYILKGNKDSIFVFSAHIIVVWKNDLKFVM